MLVAGQHFGEDDKSLGMVFWPCPIKGVKRRKGRPFGRVRRHGRGTVPQRRREMGRLRIRCSPVFLGPAITLRFLAAKQFCFHCGRCGTRAIP